MIVVIYDKATGRIRECRSASAENIKLITEPYVEVDTHLHTWDATHEVVNGVIQPRDPAIIAAETRTTALRKLRVKRNALLASDVDSFGPARWASLSEADREAVAVYRQALLDITQPSITPDPTNPTWPTLVLSTGAVT